ncbi:RHS repeat-associated core domain-containing protein [Streptomyces sp. MS1.HAVA.3]|uniref:RHS repeat-associated core domain-containing protein n=1 Tax=Streptomyces caledonius TaxID=3134107 RepID=A0ABU8U933_9ACTN
MGAREYDPFLGKFITPDPVVDSNDAQQLNAYAYAHDRPVSASDPTGLYDPDERAYCQSHPSSCAGGKVKTNTTPDQQDVNDATDDLNNAENELSGAKGKVKEAVKQITKILMDELGVTAALDCFSSGDLGSCGETALNIAGSFAGGLAGKVLAKYGAPWKWEKAGQLIKRLAGLAGDLIDGAKAWWNASEKVKKAKGALEAAKARLRKTCEVPHSFLPGTRFSSPTARRRESRTSKSATRSSRPIRPRVRRRSARSRARS